MSSTAIADKRIDVLFEELAELTDSNTIDGRLVEIIAEIDRDGLWGNTGCQSIPALVAWKTGCSPANAKSIATVAHRLEEFPRCALGMREGRLSLDQVRVIAERAGQGSDAHYAALASVATVKVAHRGQATATRPRPPAGTAALDHPAHRRGLHLLADQTSPTMRRRCSTRPCPRIGMR